jgi:hypothetical protein
MRKILSLLGFAPRRRVACFQVKPLRLKSATSFRCKAERAAVLPNLTGELKSDAITPTAAMSCANALTASNLTATLYQTM